MNLLEQNKILKSCLGFIAESARTFSQRDGRSISGNRFAPYGATAWVLAGFTTDPAENILHKELER